MGQNTNLTTGNTEATSTDVVLAAGASANVGIFGAAGAALPVKVNFSVSMDTPSGDSVIGLLNQKSPVMLVTGPGTFRVKRPAYTGNAFGVFSET